MMKNAIDPQKNFKKWLEANKEKVVEFINQNDVSVRDLDFDHRIVNILETDGLQFLSDILWKSAVELRKLDFVGRDESERIVLGCRFYLRNKMDEIVAFCKEESGETSESAPEEQILIRVSKTKEAMQPSSAKEISLTDTTLPEAKSENNIVLPNERYREMPIEVLELSKRSYNALRRGGFNTVSDLIGSYDKGFSHIQNLGKQSVEEIYEKLDAFFKEDCPVPTNEKTETMEAEIPLLPESEYSFSFEEIMQSDVLKMECVAFFEENADRFIFSQIPFSVRAKNALLNHSVHQLSELIKLYPDGILSIKNLGKKTLLELEAIARGIVEANIGAISYYIQQTDEWMKKRILQLIQSDGFRGYSFEQIKTAVPAVSDEDRIKKAVGSLLEKGLIEYVDFRCYPVYPSFFKAIQAFKDKLTQRENEVLNQRLAGKSLEEIGTELGLSRERVRQIFLKANRKIKNLYLEKSEFPHYDEEYYEYLFTNYLVGKDFWTDFLKLPQSTLSFLKNFYTLGDLPLNEAENDPNLSLNLKIKIRYYLDLGKIKINGELIKAERAVLEDYAIKILCQDEMTWNDFCAAYNRLLADNRVPFDERLYYTEECIKSRKNRVSASKLCLWIRGSRLRYYDIEAQDYSELLEGIGFEQYADTAISTLKWFNDFPELMEKFDIRDQYELHNLLKKTISSEMFPDVSFGRQPMIVFGSFNQKDFLLNILRMIAPVSFEDFLEFLYRECGFDKGTAVGSYCSSIKQYLHNGIFTLNYKTIPPERKTILLDSLTDDFYFIFEIEKAYGKLFPEADPEEINPHSLKAVGLTVMSNYVLTKHETAESFFEDLLTREDVYSIESFQKRYGTIQMYNQTYRRMRENYDIFLFENDQIITMNRLNKVGVTKEIIREFCESVYDFVDDGELFTIFSLRKAGFSSKLDDLGFDDSFYNGILAINASFIYQRVFHRIVLMKGASGMLSKKQFILSELSHYDVVDVDEFVDDVEAEYGIRIPERNEITRTLESTDFYYNETMNRIYRNKELYYDDLED